MEHDLPDELIISSEPVLVNDGDLNQLNSSLGRGPGGLGAGGGNGTAGMGLGFGPGPGGETGTVGGGQDAVAKHKQLSELLRTTTSSQQGHQGVMSSPGGPAGMGQHLGNMKTTPGQGPQQMMGQQQQHLSPQQQANIMQQQQTGMMSNRGMLGVQQKANNGQQQPGMIGNQVMNGSPRMGFGNQGMAGSGSMLVDTLQQQGAGGQGAMRGQQHGAMNKVRSLNNVLLINCVALQKRWVSGHARSQNRSVSTIRTSR